MTDSVALAGAGGAKLTKFSTSDSGSMVGEDGTPSSWTVSIDMERYGEDDIIFGQLPIPTVADFLRGIPEYWVNS
jgi:hypothetical protein